ncbi:MAG: class I SAM-dependent methyltransferase, partial [Acidobacteriota bacterium]
WNLPLRRVDLAYDNLNSHKRLWQDVESKLSIYPKNYGSQMTRELPALYLLVRLTKPKIVVETGVASGASSAYMLRALKDNQRGRLYSIDLPPANLPDGKKSGWVVPESLGSRWSLYIRDSKEILRPLLKELGEIDGFLHDSLHTYDHMLWEFRTAWEHLRPGGLFLSHDVGANEAFLDFMKEKKVSWSGYRVFHVLGGFRRQT